MISRKGALETPTYFDLMKINLKDAIGQVDGYWNPLIVGELNGQHMKVAKFKGEFDWHHHDNEDECFIVIRGSFEMHLRDRIEVINEGEFFIVPRGVEHRPVAKEETHVLLFEPATTVNTGNVISEKTQTVLKAYKPE